MIKNIKPHHKVLVKQNKDLFSLPHAKYAFASLIHQLETIKNTVPLYTVPLHGGKPLKSNQT